MKHDVSFSSNSPILMNMMFSAMSKGTSKQSQHVFCDVQKNKDCHISKQIFLL